VIICFSGLIVADAARADSINLKTQTGNALGASLSSYKYQEPGFMSLTGAKLGLDLRSTNALQDDRFLRGDLRYAFGTVDYRSNGTGSAAGEPDWYIEMRVLGGKDLSVGSSVLSPYAGLGYRYLFNDARGISSSGAGGYRRESSYVYLPIGVVHHTAINNQTRLLSSLEYDHLVAGKQMSMLSDAGGGYSDATNTQYRGYGLKLSIIYDNEVWAIGPYANYWNIEQSNVVPEIRYGTPTGRGLVEPKNNTLEFGLKASQKF